MKIFETEFWRVELLEDQYYLGRSVVVLKRECGELSGLTDEEFLDLLCVIKRLEGSVKKVFGASMFNWTCLMNHAYKAENPSPQVHLHFRPRYRDRVEFAGEVFEDEDFAHHYNRKREKIVSDEVMGEICKAICD